MVKDTKLYDVLEVAPNASENEISQSYKKLARKYHPDKNPDDAEASKKLQEINAAKEILLDSQKRNMYDQLGMDYLQNNNGGGEGHSHEDIFNMFGGFGGFGGMRGNQQQKENIVINETVTLNKIFNEESITVNFKQKNFCSNCKGEGTNDGSSSKCNGCNGVGVVIQTIRMGPMIQQMQSTCGLCRGTGKISKPENKCKECNGEGTKLKDVRLNFPLKNGLTEGQQIQLPNQGHQTKDGRTDLLIVIHVEEHPIFKRNGDDLIIDIELKLYQALFGFDKIIEHLDKRKLLISHTGKTEYNQSRKIIGEGMKSLQNNSNGNLIINFKYKLPNITNIEINQKLQTLLKSIDETEANNELNIRVNKSLYKLTTMIDHVNKPKEQHEQTSRVHVEGHPQCAQS